MNLNVGNQHQDQSSAAGTNQEVTKGHTQSKSFLSRLWLAVSNLLGSNIKKSTNNHSAAAQPRTFSNAIVTPRESKNVAPVQSQTDKQTETSKPVRRIKFKAVKTLIVNVLFSLLTLLAYHATSIPPDESEWAPFVGYLVPVFMAIQLAFLFNWGVRGKPIHFLVPLLTLVAGYPHIRSTISINPAPDVENHDLKVVSYNIRQLQGYGKVKDKTREEAKALINWLKDSDADIVCLQEYYNNKERFGFDFKDEMKDVGYKYSFYSKAKRTFFITGEVGVMIYSKFPIKGTKAIHKSDGPNNQVVYADIKTPKGIIRVFDVHLHSLQLKEKELRTTSDQEKLKQNAKSVGFKLKQGFAKRLDQVMMLDSAVAASPLPVLVCGDFNDMPYSYTYRLMRKRLNNAFEEAGAGFDFSYNGIIPFLRIDNQWMSKEFKALNFETWTQVSLSDHFPIVAWYQLDTTSNQSYK